MEKEGFIKDSKLALKGVLNGVFGSFVYELIIMFLVSFIISYTVTSNNPDASSLQLETLINDAYASFPFSILISCLSNLVVLGVFVYILKFERIKEILKKAFNKNTLKWGILIGVSAMLVSMVYNGIVVSVFDLDSVGNANQNNVIDLILSQPILGFLSVVILAPLVEELTFRYCLFGGLYEKNKKIAYIVSGLVFMLMHSVASFVSVGEFNREFLIELIYLPPYLISGILLCYAYDKTDNLGSSMIAHSLNNLVSFLGIVLL